MLSNLSIKNYALIEELSIDISDGLTIITGETGAGKSILLGALGLVLGNRADLSSLKDETQKCVVEASLSISNYQLQEFFEKENLDYEPQTILRREILPSGKSRAFINDTPVNLNSLNRLRSRLIDIHSQHQTLELSDNTFLFSLLDALAENNNKVSSYQRGLTQLRNLQKQLTKLESKQRDAQQQYDYNLHLYKELESVNLKKGEQEELEKKLEKINNLELIKSSLSESLQLSQNENAGIQDLLHTVENRIQNISEFSDNYKQLSDRITSLKIEFDDIVSELDNENEDVEFNPFEVEELNDRLQLIYSLQKKHHVSSIEELLNVYDDLATKVEVVESSEQAIHSKKKEIETIEEKLDRLAQKISSNRTKVIPNLKKELEFLLGELGMSDAKFQIEIHSKESYFSNGKDELVFQFSANKGSSFGELKKVASGGELSRIMLAIKKILSVHSNLPTIIFDEIDTGVSGEISNKIASIMKQMSSHMQVLTITHLPQIAGKGNHHFKVFKDEIDGKTSTRLKELNADERIVEIAEMLSGKNISDSAIVHAKELLN